MNRPETAKLLAKVQLIDNRTVDRATVEAWHEAIGHQDYPDAVAALDLHRRDSTAWVQPADINALVPVVRRNRAHVAGAARALTAGPPAPVQGPPVWFREAAGLPARSEHSEVGCPWCGAKPHSPCTVRGTERRMEREHPARTEAAAK